METLNQIWRTETSATGCLFIKFQPECLVRCFKNLGTGKTYWKRESFFKSMNKKTTCSREIVAFSTVSGQSACHWSLMLKLPKRNIDSKMPVLSTNSTYVQIYQYSNSNTWTIVLFFNRMLWVWSRAQICGKAKRNYDSGDLLVALISLFATLPLTVLHSQTQTWEKISPAYRTHTACWSLIAFYKPVPGVSHSNKFEYS